MRDRGKAEERKGGSRTRGLVSGLTPLLLDNSLQLLELSLGSEKCSELNGDSKRSVTDIARHDTDHPLTLFLVSFRAFLSLEFLNNSMIRFS